MNSFNNNKTVNKKAHMQCINNSRNWIFYICIAHLHKFFSTSNIFFPNKNQRVHTFFLSSFNSLTKSEISFIIWPEYVSNIISCWPAISLISFSILTNAMDEENLKEWRNNQYYCFKKEKWCKEYFFIGKLKILGFNLSRNYSNNQ